MTLEPVLCYKNPMITNPRKGTATLSATTDSVSNSYSYESDLRYGFKPESLEIYFYDIVRHNPKNEMLVDYGALIPVLVQSIQDLQTTVESQSLLISQLTSQQGNRAMAESTSRIISCSPNPASGNVTVFLTVDAGVNDGRLVISDMFGNNELTSPVSSIDTQFVI